LDIKVKAIFKIQDYKKVLKGDNCLIIMDTLHWRKNNITFSREGFSLKCNYCHFFIAAFVTEDTINFISTWIYSSQKNNFLIGCTRRL